jgi:hypothetical protein
MTTNKQSRTEYALHEVAKIIEWYRGLPDRLNADRETLDGLTKARRSLSCERVIIGTYCSRLKREKERTYFARKAAFSEQVIKLRERMSATDAKEQAVLLIREKKTAEIEADAAYERARNLHDNIKEILNSMASDINALRDEYSRSGIANEV